MLSTLRRIAQTPAPTFDEGARGELMAALWSDLGHAVHSDAVGNVWVRLGPPGPPLVLAAHLDTVFGADTDVTVREQGGRMHGPGVGDNSASLAVLTGLLETLDPGELQRGLVLLANPGEEGLGDLYGARHFLETQEAAQFVAVDGYLGMAVTQAVGVRRYRARFTGQGGHSWGDSTPSAAHAMGRAIAALYAMPLSGEPRSTLNVGVAQAGGSVNSIAASAELLLDLRSLSQAELESMAERARGLLHAVAREVGVGLHLEQVGDRPGGDLRAGTLYRAAEQAARDGGIRLQAVASSTDANAATVRDIPALSLGVYRGGNAHRLDEWVDLASLDTGLRLLRRFVRAAQTLG